VAQFGKIKQWLLQRDLYKKLSRLQRNKEFFNLKKSKTFGVVFDASTEASYNRVSSFVRHIQSHNKIVKAIGFVDAKEVPHYIMQTISYDYVTRKDLDFALRPRTKFINDFFKQEFDVLVDFNLDNNPVLFYCSALSRAKFKIGMYNPDNENVFDFLIQGIDEKSMARYAKEVLNFLETLETK